MCRPSGLQVTPASALRVDVSRRLECGAAASISHKSLNCASSS
jgi:hypothetical protein